MSARIATKQVQIPLAEWEALAELSTREGIPARDLVQEALRWYLAEKSRIAQKRQLLQYSSGVWRDRKDLPQDSVDLVNELREDWRERAQRLGLARFVLDFDVLIDHLRGYQAATDLLDALLLDGVEVCFSVVSEAEIYSNVRPGEERRVLALFGTLTRLGLDGTMARKAGEYRSTYLRSHGLTLPDALIAATASIHRAGLLTRNLGHFPMTDILVEAPYQL